MFSGCEKYSDKISSPITTATDKFCQEQGFERSYGGHTENGEAIMGYCMDGGIDGKEPTRTGYFCYKGKEDKCKYAESLHNFEFKITYLEWKIKMIDDSELKQEIDIIKITPPKIERGCPYVSWRRY